MSGYAVIDFETTGFMAARHDRVIEVGLVHADEHGEIEDQWTTLVNPERDVGPTSHHGIRAADVLEAPTFGDLAAEIVRSVRGRTLVGHNARFDVGFLENELGRAGLRPAKALPYVCTMEWSQRFTPQASRKLADCCAAVGVPFDGEHGALTSAVATAGLLKSYLAQVDAPPWAAIVGKSEAFAWPELPEKRSSVVLVGRRQLGARPDSWISKIASRLPRVGDAGVESYLAVLEHALIDGFLSAHEKAELVEVASLIGLHRDQLDRIHRTYLDQVARAAWEDGIVTDEELWQVTLLARSFGFDEEVVYESLAEARTQPVQAGDLRFELAPGDRIALTGELGHTHEEWRQRLEADGLQTGPITRESRLLVAADTDTLSRAAARARVYGIPIVAEEWFLRVVGEFEAAHGLWPEPAE
jgi:DNA polymerase-3 subunit epsilon